MTFGKEDASGLEIDDLHVEIGAAGDDPLGIGAELDAVDLQQPEANVFSYSNSLLS